MSNIKKILNFFLGGTPSSAFDDVLAEWRADTFTGVSPNIVLTDLTGNGYNMTQAAGTLTPGTGTNGQAKMTGNATARLTSTLSLKSWPYTFVFVFKRANNATCGFIGHTGATPFNTSWFGFESANALTIYNLNSAANTTAEAGSDACYVARGDWGSRVGMVNGVVQPLCQLASIVQTATATMELGTSYRGLNGEFQHAWVWDRALSITELDEVYTAVNTRYGMSIPLSTSLTGEDMVIITGDSMASGRALRGALDVNVPVEYQGAQTDVKIWYGTPASAFGTSWDTYNLSSNNTQLNDQLVGGSTTFGSDTSLGKEYVDRTSRAINILKSSTGSASITKLSTNTYFDPTNNSLAQSNQTRGYGSIVKNYWRARATLQASSKRPIVKGIVIFLGTNDSVDQTAADNFATQGIALAAQLRKDIGLAAADSKIFWVRMHTGTTGGTYETTIRTKTAEIVASVPNSVMVDVDSYTIFDGIHINPAGNIDLGNYLQGLL